MLKMRLQRIGRKNDPSYRVVVVDSRQGPKSGKFVDLIGSYNPKMDRVAVDGEKAKEWISKGVQCSPTVHNILVGEKVIDGKKVNVLPKKSPIVSEKEEVEEAPAADAAAEENTEAPAEGEATETEEAPAEEVKVEEPAEAEDSEAKNEASEKEEAAESEEEEAKAAA